MLMAQHMKWVSLALIGVVLVLCSCKKKGAEAQPPQTADSAPAAGASPNPADPGQGTTAQPAPAINTTAAISDVNEAMKARDYQKATATLLAVQQQPLNPQQAAVVHQQMVQLQGALAGAVASGDPNAKAAADRLRASAKH